MKIVDGRVQCLSAASTETDRVIEHAIGGEKLGASAIVATAPFYALGGLPEIEAPLSSHSRSGTQQ